MINFGTLPFSHEITADEPLCGSDYLPYGSTSFTMATHALKWRGQYFDPDTFRADVWNRHRTDMLNTDSPKTVKKAIVFLSEQEPDSLWFIRPTEDLKTFSGQVIDAGEGCAWLTDAMTCASSGSYQLAPDTPLMLAMPRQIQAEWRWFIVDSKIVSGSLYRLRGALHKKQDLGEAVIQEAQQFANGWLPAPFSPCRFPNFLVNSAEKPAICLPFFPIASEFWNI